MSINNPDRVRSDPAWVAHFLRKKRLHRGTPTIPLPPNTNKKSRKDGYR